MAEKIIGRGYITIADLKDGESARTFVLVPSVESVTKKLDGSLSVAKVSCAVYKVTGNSAYALSNEHTLTYLRTPDGAKGELSHSEGVSEEVEILAETESVEFELSDGKVVIDRVRVPILSDATDVNDALDKYKYLKAALQDGTTINGGLLLTSVVSLGENNTDYTTQKVWSGMSGVFDTDKQGKSIASWYGGDMIDMADYYDWNEDTHKWVLKAGANVDGLRLAQGLDRMDGTGYRAGGNLWWDESGNVHADPLSFFVGEEAVGNVAALFKFYPYNNAEFSKTTAVEPTRVFTRLRIGSKDGMDYIELAYEKGNLKVGGNIVTNGDVIALNQGSAEGGTGGSGSGGIDLAALEAYLKAQKYATQSWVTSQGYLTAITKAQVESVLTGAIASHTHAFATLTSKPTTLNGYGITDAYTQAEINTKLTNGSVTKIGTASVGSSTKPIYLNAGKPTASSSTIGSSTKPMYMNSGTLTACSYTFGNASGNAALNNGTLNTNLNADLLDGKHAGTANGNVAIYVSFPPASTLKSGGYLADSFVASASNADELYFKALCCWCIDNYPKGGILQGRVNPNAFGYCVIQLYANGKDATTGLPQHCSGMYLSLLQAVETFGTYDYTWNWGGMSVPKLKIGDCQITWNSSKKALEFSKTIISDDDVVAYNN